MVLNINIELEARMQEMYKSMLDVQKAAEERKELTPNEFWDTMKVVSLNNQSLVKYRNR